MNLTMIAGGLGLLALAEGGMSSDPEAVSERVLLRALSAIGAALLVAGVTHKGAA